MDPRTKTGITALCILTGTLAFALISQSYFTSVEIRDLEKEVAYRTEVANKVADQCVRMCSPPEPEANPDDGVQEL